MTGHMAPLQRMSHLTAKALRRERHPEAAPFLTKRRVKCLTLNVLASPVPFNRMERERLRCLLGQIERQQYDVVALQELLERNWCGVSLNRRYADFVDALRRLGYRHHVAGPAPRLGAPLDGGTAIFSKHPIVSSSLHPWQKQVSWDSWASKGIVRALIDIPAPAEDSFGRGALPIQATPARLHVVTLHAQASHAGWQNTAGEGRYRSTRLEQMRQLTEVLREEAADGEAVLAFGDFNFNARDLRELELHQAPLAEGTGRSQPPLDVLAANFGEHPVTFGARDGAGRPLETFLTCKVLRTSGQCLDHVYYWPAEPGAAGYFQGPGPAGFEPFSSQGFVYGEPRCTLEVCPYNGPSSPTGRRPTQVSDHYGWSVEFDVAWQLQPSHVEPRDSLWRRGVGHVGVPNAWERWNHLRLAGLLEDGMGWARGLKERVATVHARGEAVQLPARNMLHRMWQRMQKASQEPLAA